VRATLVTLSRFTRDKWGKGCDCQFVELWNECNYYNDSHMYIPYKFKKKKKFGVSVSCLQFHFRSGWLTSLPVGYQALNAVNVTQQAIWVLVLIPTHVPMLSACSPCHDELGRSGVVSVRGFTYRDFEFDHTNGSKRDVATHTTCARRA
jgi:hypothetical protein